MRSRLALRSNLEAPDCEPAISSAEAMVEDSYPRYTTIDDCLSETGVGRARGRTRPGTRQPMSSMNEAADVLDDLGKMYNHIWAMTDL